MRWAAIAVIAALSAPVSWGQTKTEGFVIDPSKPFVFIEFDHIGARKPVFESESPQGLWLRIVNNCRVPIRVDAFDPRTGDPGMALSYQVLPVYTGDGYITKSGKIWSGHAVDVPQGYTPFPRDVIHEVIEPGRSLLFSIPEGHVQPGWYIQVKFQFDLAEPVSGYEPISLVEFYWMGIPTKYRKDVPDSPDKYQ